MVCFRIGILTGVRIRRTSPMSDPIALASTGLAFFVVAVSPGPATISNAAIAMSYGRRTSLVYGLGLSCGLVFWGLVAASGMGAVLNTSLYVLPVLKALGGIYLLRLAWLSGRKALQPPTPATTQTTHNGTTWFWRGFILNLSNPKSVIAWMAALSVGLDPNADIAAIVLATSVCILVGFATNAFYSLLFSMDGMTRSYTRARRAIDGAVAGMFAIAGLGLIRSALQR